MNITIKDLSLIEYNHALCTLLWHHPVTMTFFQEMECSWLDGGCHTLARALYQHLQEQGYKVTFAAIVDENSEDVDEDTGELYTIRHVVTEVHLVDGNRYVDANGVQTASELIREWERRLRKPIVLDDNLSSDDDLALLEFEVPTFSETVKPLIAVLRELSPCPL